MQRARLLQQFNAKATTSATVWIMGASTGYGNLKILKMFTDKIKIKHLILSQNKTQIT